MKTVTVVVDFYEATARWGLSRWFRDVIEVDFMASNTVLSGPWPKWISQSGID